MFQRPRIIPVLLIENQYLIKTKYFKDPVYLGDPINALRIFNEKEVDEVCIIDKSTNIKSNGIDFSYLKNICSEAFMPLSYGGGIKSINDVKMLFKMGFEKVILNTSFFENPSLLNEISEYAGKQSVVVSIDYKIQFDGIFVYTNNGKRKINMNLISAAKLAIEHGAGEILLTCINKEGSFQGFDYDNIKKVTSIINVPVIANGGCSSVSDIKKVLTYSNASAAAASSFFVFYGAKKAVLINYPKQEELIKGGIYFE